MPEAILRDGVRPALHHAGIRTIRAHNCRHNLLEELEIGIIVNAFLQRHVNREEPAYSLSNRVQRSSPREEILIKLMKRHSHDPIRIVEGLFNSIAMMHVYIQIQHPRIHLQQFKDAYDNIVDIAKATGFCFFGVMVASSPIDGDIRNTSDDDVCGVDAPTRSQLTEVIKPIEAGTIEALIDFKQRLQFRIIPDLALLIFLVLRNDFILLAGDPFLQVLNVGLVMKEAKFFLAGLLTLKHHQMITQLVTLDERMGHFDAFGLHGMLLTEMIIGDGFVIEVAYLSHYLNFIELRSSSAFIYHP